MSRRPLRLFPSGRRTSQEALACEEGAPIVYQCGRSGTRVGLVVGLLLALVLFYYVRSFWLSLYALWTCPYLCYNVSGKVLEEKRTIGSLVYAVIPTIVSLGTFGGAWLIFSVFWLPFLLAAVAESVLGQYVRMLLFPEKEQKYYSEQCEEFVGKPARPGSLARMVAPPGMREGVAAGFTAIRAYNSGNAHYNRSEFSEAIACYTEAIAQASHDPNADLLRVPDMYFNRALAHAALLEREEAASDHSHAIALDPTYEDISFHQRLENNIRVATEEREQGAGG